MKPFRSVPAVHRLTGAAILAALCGPLLGAEAPIHSPRAQPETFSIERIVSQAMEANAEVKFYEAEIQAARAGRTSAGAWRNPELAGGVGQKSATGGGLASEGVAWSVSLMQPFEWPGRIGLRKAIANRDQELANLGLERFKSDLAGRIRTLAFSLLVAQEKSAVARDVADRFKSLREVLVQRDPAGLTPLLEVRVIEAIELNAQRRASASLLTIHSALLTLNQLRGAKPDDALVVEPSVLRFPPPESIPNLLEAARTNNFELRTRTAELLQQGLRVSLARNERYPSFSLGPTVSEERVGGGRERILGVGIALPLPLWTRNKGNVDMAAARQLQAEASLTAAEREMERKVIEFARTYEAKLSEMAQWQPDSIGHFQEAAELADRHYRLGAVPISTYVELQKQYYEAVEGLLDTKKEAVEAAAQLEMLTGLRLPLSQTAPSGEKK